MIQAELLTETTEHHFRKMLSDPSYGFQEKHNGHRLLIVRQEDELLHFNRKGEISSKALPLRLRNALMNHPVTGFVIDGELVDNTFHIFDALILGDEVMTNDAYEYREARYHALFDTYSPYIAPVKTARTSAEKQALWMNVQKSQGEGIVSKNMRKGYKQGDAGQHWKLKFWKMADAFVIGPSPEGHDSIEIGMVDAKGRIHRVSGCSLLVNAAKKQRPQTGDVIEVRFLYATKERHIVQPTLLRIRTDKRAAECTLSQLDPYVNKNWTGAAK